MNAHINDPSQLNSVLKKSDIKYLERACAYPFVKWAGGKRALVPEIVQVLPEKFNDYYEPFLGGGAVFFGLYSRIHKNVYLSDLNAELVLTFKIVQKFPNELIKMLKWHELQHSKNPKKHYSNVRDRGHAEQDAVKLASRFIYLNKTCYNGLYRVNKQGKFNVPMGSYKNPKICDETNLYCVSKVLENVDLKVQSFEAINPSSGDLVYCDPPYDGTFDQYTEMRFNQSDQDRLRKVCDNWCKQGAYVVVSSSDTDFIRKVWNGYKFVEIRASRNINSQSSGRGKVSELLIVNLD